MKKYSVLIVLMVSWLAVSPLMSITAKEASAQTTSGGNPSVILLIGDGMGLSHTHFAEIYAAYMLGEDLAVSSIQQRTTTYTASLDSEITDSAAAGTALLSGQKTNVGMINVLPDGDNTYTLGEAVHEAGEAVGIVSTARITHATPASVYGHTTNRDDENDLAVQLVAFAPEVALGGGWQHFLHEDIDDSVREDDRDLIAEIASLDYTMVSTGSDLAAVDTESTNRLIGLFSQDHMSYAIDRVTNELDQPSLATMTDSAIRVLDNNPEGFFLVVEGGRIDHAAEQHDLAAMVNELLAFDAAIQVALDYQAQNPNVLIIVTADHESGGLSLGRDSLPPDMNNLAAITCSFSYLGQLITEDNNMFDVAEQCGFDLNENQVEQITTNDVSVLEGVGNRASHVAHYVVSEYESELAAIRWGTWGHTAQPVITYAIGPGAQAFMGGLDNTDIAPLLAQILGVQFTP